MNTFDFIRQQYLPFRVNTLVELSGVYFHPTTTMLTLGERVVVETTTYPYYPMVVEEHVGFDSSNDTTSSTAYGFGARYPMTLPTDESSDPAYNPADANVAGAYGFDFPGQPDNTTYENPTFPTPTGHGRSVSVTEVNGLVSPSITTVTIINTTPA